MCRWFIKFVHVCQEINSKTCVPFNTPMPWLLFLRSSPWERFENIATQFLTRKMKNNAIAVLWTLPNQVFLKYLIARWMKSFTLYFLSLSKTCSRCKVNRIYRVQKRFLLRSPSEGENPLILHIQGPPPPPARQSLRMQPLYQSNLAAFAPTPLFRFSLVQMMIYY